ncbi:MAG: NAD(P)H-dependent oxidoreductase [Bacteroidales bacterium]|nr:NAD(P)H-dependent oxidoreductase [Bacteroidales bacterium]
MKTLIVSYLPGGSYSNTKQLFDHILGELKNTEVEHLNLLETSPDFFNNESIMAYYSRNYQGKELNQAQKDSLKKMDLFANQVSEADLVVMVYPMYNFGMPGIVKTWFDGVMQAGVAFEYGPNGPVGLFKNKKALVLFTSGGSYSEKKYSGKYPDWDTISLLSEIEFSFMGFSDVEVVSASTSDSGKKQQNIDLAKQKASEILKGWGV